MPISAEYNIPWVAASGSPSEVTVDLGTEDSDWEAGDLAVISLWTRSTAARSWTQKSGTSGWSGQTENDWNNGTSYWCHAVWTKVLEEDEPNPTFIHTAGGGGIGAIGTIIRGVDATTPLDGVTAARNTGAGATATASSVETQTPGAWALRIYVWHDNSAGVGSYSQGAELYDHSETDSPVGSTHAMSYEEVASPGAAGDTTAVGSGLDGGDVWSTFTLSVRAAGSDSPAVAFDDSAKTISASTTTSLTVTATPPFDDPITQITTPGGDTIAAESGATESAATFLIPSLAQFAVAGSMNNTRLGQSGSWVVTDGTDTASASLTLSSPSGYILKTLAATTGAIPTEIGGAEDIGDDILCWGEDLNDVDTSGDVNVSAFPTTVNFRWYDVSAGAWQAEDSISVAEPVVLVASTDSATYADGEDIEIILTPDDVEAPNALTLHAVNVFAVFTADGTAGGTLAGFAVSDFLPGGDLDTVPWFTFVDLVVGFAVAPDSTVQILFTGPEANISNGVHWSGQVGEDPEGFLAGYPEGMPWYLVSDPNCIDSINNGIPTVTGPGSANLYIYDDGEWTDEGDVIVQIATVPNATMFIGREYTIDYNNHLWGGDGTAVWSTPSGDGLPDGFELDEDTGIATGTISEGSAVLLEDIVVRKTVGAVANDTNPHNFNVISAPTAIWARTANPQVIQ